MTGAVVSASADAGGHGRAVGLVVAVSPAAAASPAAIHSSHVLDHGAAPAFQTSDPGTTRDAGGPSGSGNGSGNNSGNGSGNGGTGSYSRATTPPPAGNTGSGGDGGNSQGQAGGRDGNPGSSGGPSGRQRGEGGGGSPSGGGDSGGSTSGGSGSSQDGGSSHPRGSGSGNGNGSSGSGSGSTAGGNANGGTSGRCGSACQIGQQTGPVASVTFTPTPTQTVPVATPTQPARNPRPIITPRLHLRTPGTYSTSASSLIATRRSSTTAGLLGLGATISPALRAGTTTTGSALRTGTPSAITTLLGSATSIRTSSHGSRGGDGGDGGDGGARATEPRPVVTQPIAQQTFIGSIEQAVPPSIWLALAAAFAFGAVGSGLALYSGHRVRRQAGAFAAMSTAALTDQLTGLLNRRGFLEAVERELARAQRYGRGFVLAYVDVRGLKAVNDTEGHRAGDELLKEAASLLQDSARAGDVVGRLGGDEMGLLLAEQDSGGADAVRLRIESQVPERRANLGLHSPWDLTIGTAAYPDDGETVDDLLRVADLRLYEQRGIELIDR